MKKTSHVLFGIEYSKRAFILLTLLVTAFTVFAQKITHVPGVPFDLMASARSDTHKNTSTATQFGSEDFVRGADVNQSPSVIPGFPLATPIIVGVVGTTPNDIRVSFINTNVDEYGYLFYYSTNPDGPFTAEDWVTDYGYGGVENYQTAHAGYEPNTLVYIKVAALIIDPVLQYPVQGSEFTELVSATTMAGWPPAPSDFVATAEGDHIRLTWVDNSPPGHPLDEGEWNIQRSLDGVNFDRVYSVPANVSTFVDYEVTPGLTYVYRLEAMNVFGNGNEVFFASATAGNVVAQLYGTATLGGTSDVGTIFKINLDGDDLTKVFDFNNTNGEHPNGSLIQASDGLLYGITRAGGSIGYGTIFSVNSDGTGYRILHNFDQMDGSSVGSLTQASDGSLWGMTQTGTRNIFRINLDGSGYTVLTRFFFRSPATPGPAYGSLLQVGDSFFGMTSQGPRGFVGFIFKINATGGGGVTGVHNFSGNDGASPTGSLIQAPDGFIYGTTSAGGATGSGTIFRLNPDGSGHTVLFNFQNWTGAAPFGALTQATPTSLIGLTSAGGPHGLGTIFKINTDGTGHTVLYDFDGSNGATPLGDPIVFGNKVFGYTSSGGAHNNGVLFCYDLVSSTYRKLADLSYSIGKNPTYGSLLVYTPQDPVVNPPQEPATNISFGNVLSTSMTVSFTPGDGTNHLVVMKAGSAPTFLPVDDTFYSGDLGNGESVVYNGTDSTFNVTGLQSDTEYFFTIFDFNTDGVNARYLIANAAVASWFTKGISKQLWGMTHQGGANGGGTIFKLNTSGTNLSVVHSFDNVTGGGSRNSLIQTSDELILGMTQAGGTTNNGVIFKINENGSGYNVMHEFEGGWPMGSLIQASDGFIFGANLSSIFRTNADGTNYTELHQFDNTMGTSVAAGSLIQATDGSLYGMTNSFFEGPGSVFKINTDGSDFKVLSDFDGLSVYPWGAVTQGSDGALYGMTAQGGPSRYGTIFKINTDGSNYSVLHNFNNTDGSFPYNGLTAATDGWLYGMTYLGGYSNGGTLFKIRIDGGGFTVLHQFTCGTGCGSTGNLIIYQNKLFGYTTFGGLAGGVIFNYDLATNTYNKLSDLNSLTGEEPMFGGLLLVDSDGEPAINAPTTPASNISFANVFSTSMQVSFTQGNGARRLAVMKAGSAPTFQPVDSFFYSGDLGNGESVVYNDAGSTFKLTGLQPDIEYFFTIFEFNSDGTESAYLVDDAPVASARTLNSTIKDFSLIYSKSGKAVFNFHDTLTLDVAVRDLEKYTIRANVMTEVGSVKFTMDGVAANIENYKPYTLSPWILSRLSAGVHPLGAQAFSKKNAQGEGFEKREAVIIITNSAAVTQFDLVDKKTGTLIRTLFDGDVINISQAELKDFDIVARTNVTTTESVKFSLNGAVGIDNHRPYQLNRHKKIKPGSYTLKATPFVKDNAWGPPGVPLTIHFSVINVPIPSSLVVDRGLVVTNDEVNHGSSEDLNSREVLVYPVPVKDELTISMKDVIAGNFVLKIMDMNGKTVYTSEGTVDNPWPIVIGTNRLGLSRGMYVIYIRQVNGSVLMKKFIKE